MSLLPAVLAEYDGELEDVEDIIALKGKTLEKANRENPAWHGYYDQKKVELGILVKFMEANVAKVRSKLFRDLSNFNQREMSDNAKNKYIDSEDSYLLAYELYLETKEMYDKFEVVSKAFQTRGYALNNLTKIVVAEATNYII